MDAPPAPELTRRLRARGLGRSYRRTRALQGVDLDVRAGESVALLGPNGSGKTTLLTILAGVGRRDEGTVEWSEPAAGAVGWVPQHPAVYSRLTTRENLLLFAGLEGAGDVDARTDDLLRAADLTEFADRRASELSTGTLQRLNFAIALAGRPSVLLLDEPTGTVSPDQRRRLWEWLERMRADEGLALVFSTQSVDEASRHADRMLVLAEGRPVFEGTADGLVAAHGRPGDAGDDRAGAAFLRLIETTSRAAS
jgi:ABC-type multidrug transport system ATPase subunit